MVVLEGTQPVSTAPKLTRRNEFEEVLKNYRISDEGLKILQETTLVVLVGPSGCGRNTVIRDLVQTEKYHFIISDTTRPPRQNNGVWEQNGVEYFFRREDDLLEDLRNGAFVEAEIIHNQQVSGTSVREIKRAHGEGKAALAELEILGSLNMAKLKPDALMIYLAPPSFDEWLNRIAGRSKLSEEELRNRLNGAIKNFRLALDNRDIFNFIINNEKDETVRKIGEIIQTGDRSLAGDQAVAQELVRSLWRQTELFLKSL